MEPDVFQGDFEQAYNDAEVTLDVTYTTLIQAAVLAPNSGYTMKPSWRVSVPCS
ncbi:MAG: hypothetical protein WD623_17245 [Marinobacter sp.]|uniref:hypothetical protein n=1 Tax=Marinobacter sp. TaxID=50741 RepID=UPI0034A04108